MPRHLVRTNPAFQTSYLNQEQLFQYHVLGLSPKLGSGDPIPLESGKLSISMKPQGLKLEVVISVDKKN